MTEEAAFDNWSRPKTLLFSLLPAIVLFASLELALRGLGVPREKYLLQRFSFPPQEWMDVSLTTDASLFWRPIPGYDGPWTSRKLVFTHERKSGVEVDEETRYAAYPDRDYFDAVRWNINPLGLRGDLPPAGRRILLTLGSSVTFGWGVAAADSFSGILARRIAEAGYEDWGVINAGVPGYTSHQALVYLDRLRRRFSVGAIVFESGINDGTWAPVRSDREVAKQIRPPKSGSVIQRSNLFLWLHYAWKRRKEEAAALVPDAPFFATSSYRPGHSRVSPSEFVENLAAARATARELDAAIYFYFPGLYNERGRERIQKSVLHSDPLEIAVVDAFAQLDAPTLARQFLPFDEAHHSRAGHQRVADHIWRRLEADGVFGPLSDPAAN